MKVHLISDIHLEYHQDAGLAFYKRLHQVEADVCIVAGDLIPLCDPRYLEVAELALNAITRQFKDVIYVLGNHEYYRGSQEQIACVCGVLEDTFDNLHILERAVVKVQGIRFAGATLWFPDDIDNHWHYRNMDDFRLIARLPYWVYDANCAATNFFAEVQADVWITHHLPSARSVPGYFKKSPLNRFFVSDLTAQIMAQQPRYVFHGHSHASASYKIGETQIIANPHGYPDKQNRKFNPSLVLTL